MRAVGFFALWLLVLSSCGRNYDASSIRGTWRVSHTRPIALSEAPSVVVNFYADGTVSRRYPGRKYAAGDPINDLSSFEFTYHVDGDRIYFTSAAKPGSNFNVEIEELEERHMALKRTYPKGLFPESHSTVILERISDERAEALLK